MSHAALATAGRGFRRESSPAALSIRAANLGRWANAPAVQVSIVEPVQLFRPFACYRHPIFVESSKIGTIGRIRRGLAGRTLIDQNGVVLTVLYRWKKFL
jgi:hypothetical protein